MAKTTDTKIYIDLEFAKTFGLSEKDFAGKNQKEQIKILDDAYANKKKDFELIGQSECFDNAEKVFPKIKESLSKPVLIFIKKKTKSGDKEVLKESIVQVVGFSSIGNKVLTISPESSTNSTLKVSQYELTDIFNSMSDLKAFREKNKSE